jgi:hypothetical protein
VAEAISDCSDCADIAASAAAAVNFVAATAAAAVTDAIGAAAAAGVAYIAVAAISSTCCSDDMTKTAAIWVIIVVAAHVICEKVCELLLVVCRSVLLIRWLQMQVLCRDGLLH